MKQSGMRLFTSVKPEQPSFNEWCKEFNVGLMYRPGQENHYQLIQEKPLTFAEILLNLIHGRLHQNRV